MPGLVNSAAQDSITTFLHAINETPEAFLTPTDSLKASTLVVAKQLLDPLASRSKVFDQIHTVDLHIEQIWQQIKLISDVLIDQHTAIDLTDLKTVKDKDVAEIDDASEQQLDVESDDVSDDQHTRSSAEEEDEDEGEAEDDDEEHGDDDDMDEEENNIDLDGDEEAALSTADEDDQESEQAEIVKDVHGLNDAFFDIDDFNKQTEIMDANYAQQQSEDDVDYNADPDLASDEDMDDAEIENANEIRYEDFFAPPRREHKPSKKRKRAHFEDDIQQSEEDELEEVTINRMQKDLFADEETDIAEEQGPKLSSHARRQHKLSEEIRQLENDNVARKDWTLMGEASARARPKDSLLEEGLDFERTSKPVPIVTEETTQTLEDMIKGRIISGLFDTVVRKIPESAHQFVKKSYELDDSKPSQSLAEVYETEIQKKQDPNGYMSAQDKKIAADHREIETLYKDLCYDLDSLSSWHYTPKPATESLDIVTSAPAISMEDAQPLTMSSAARLAPQEQYEVKAIKGEVVDKLGLPRAKSEMTGEEKQRHRRQQRAAAKKSGAQKKDKLATMSRSKQEQAGVISTLKNANVKVISNGKTKDLKTGKVFHGVSRSLKSSNLKL